jgi:hypothetical protein
MPRKTATPAQTTVHRRKDAADLKERQLRIRLTTEQKAQFTQAAEREGLDLSAWFRWLATREVRRHAETTADPKGTR